MFARRSLFLLFLALLPCTASSSAEVTRSAKDGSEHHEPATVIEARGIVTFRPRGRQRWSAAAVGLPLHDGDLVRTAGRGIHLVSLRSGQDRRVTLGPGTLVELAGAKRLLLHQGEIHVATGGEEIFTLLGPGKQQVQVAEAGVYRIDGKQHRLIELPAKPRWLQTFEQRAPYRGIGSLLAEVDGRNVALSVGYLNVQVDIRDQIARTVIEQSFVNHTGQNLEGEFSFPLPPDASISGFGMWIGGRLIEADVVEKQKAREIYESYLRRRRDPALLEWSGGNLFKARVFPILPNSEKRVRIVYTQSLPLRGGRYRYRYPLPGEILRQHPVRELAIEVNVHSDVSIREVYSPTQSVRIDKTEHAARAELHVQQQVPDRDFDLVVRLAGGQSPVTMIPFRRGDDGYFLLRITPPGADANADWQRQVVHDGDPLELLIVADTSASLDSASRQAQSTLIAAVLASLGPTDRFNVAVCDVDCQWLFDSATAANGQNIEKALDRLDRRRSLGWSDLERAFRSALQRASKRSQVIYVGDGVPTTADSDRAKFVAALQAACREKGAAAPALHAVAVGNSYDPVTLSSIASLGHGTFRHVDVNGGGERDIARVATQLLAEITQPVIRDLKVEIHGVRTAAIYPQSLPNLAAGQQQTIVGRYDPTDNPQPGEVVVTGELAGEMVRFQTSVSLNGAASGNSFVPRLWARAHLDHLLRQPDSTAVRDDIIELSQRHHIITPYTSFLVLESDRAREQFAIKRRLRDRDGEQFFAKAERQVDYALRRKQMRRAAEWRLGLGQSIAAPKPLDRMVSNQPKLYSGRWSGRGFIAGWSRGDFDFDRYNIFPGFSMGGGSGGGFGGGGGVGGGYSAGFGGGLFSFPVPRIPRHLQKPDETRSGTGVPVQIGRARPQALDAAFESPAAGQARRRRQLDASDGLDTLGTHLLGDAGWLDQLAGTAPRNRFWAYVDWYDPLFPAHTRPDQENEPKWLTTAAPAIRELAGRLQQAGTLPAAPVQVVTHQRGVGDFPHESRSFLLASPRAWLVHDYGNTLNYCDQQQRLAISRVFLMGWKRKPSGDELAEPLLLLAPTPLEDRFRWGDYSASLEPAGKDRVRLTVKSNNRRWRSEQRLLIDTRRHIILQAEHFNGGKLSSIERCYDWVNVGGKWWPKRVETTSPDGELMSTTTQEFTVLADEEFEARLKDELAVRENALLVSDPKVDVRGARRAVANGTGRCEHHVVLMMHYIRAGMWENAEKHLRELEQAGPDKPGVRWLRLGFLASRKRKQQMHTAYLDQSKTVLSIEHGAMVAADWLSEQYRRSEMPAIETIELLDELRPVYERSSLKRWLTARARRLSGKAQRDERLSVLKQLAEEYPSAFALIEYVNALRYAGQHKTAEAWLTARLEPDPDLPANVQSAIREQYIELLFDRQRYAELLALLEKEIAEDTPELSRYRLYLTVLDNSGNEEKLHATIAAWFRAGLVPGDLPHAATCRLYAAACHALGQIYKEEYRGQVPKRWRQRLADTALMMVRHEADLKLADWIMNNGPFRKTSEGRRVAETAVAMLTQRFDSLSAAQVQRYVAWSLSYPDLLDQPQRDLVIAALEKKWAAEPDANKRANWAYPLLLIFDRCGMADRKLDFLRRQAAVHETPAASYALYSELLAQPWSAAVEDEAFALLTKLTAESNPGEKLLTEVDTLQRLTNAMVDARYRQAMQQVPRPALLSDDALQSIQIGHLRTARRQYAERLRQAAEQVPLPLARWVRLERLYLELLLNRPADEMFADGFSLLQQPVPPPPAGEENVDAQWNALAERFEQRCLDILQFLAMRPTAEPALAEQFGAYLRTRLATAPEELQWKVRLYRLLAATGDAQSLEPILRRWIQSDPEKHVWRMALAYLLAEQGKFDEAIARLEAIDTAGELGPGGFRLMADWNLVLGRRKESQAAIHSLFTRDGALLLRFVDARLHEWNTNKKPIPDSEIRQVAFALRRIAADDTASGFLWRVRRAYQRSGDPRLLTVLVEALPGRQPAELFEFCRTFHSLLSEMDENTLDLLLGSVRDARRGEMPDHQRRAIDLLAFQVHHRASQLADERTAHQDAALAALRRAGEGVWLKGEPVLMAECLYQLRDLSPTLAAERLGRMRALADADGISAVDRLEVVRRLAMLLENGPAAEALAAALQQYFQTTGGRLGADANEAFRAYLMYSRSTRDYGRAERMLLKQLDLPAGSEQRLWLERQHLWHLIECLRNDVDSSLGQGAALYRGLQEKLLLSLRADNPTHTEELVRMLQYFYPAAAEKKFDGIDATADLERRAAPRLLELRRQGLTLDVHTVHNFASTLGFEVHPRLACGWLTEWIAAAAVKHAKNDTWNSLSSSLAHWKRKAEQRGPLEPKLENRMLEIISIFLRRSLETNDKLSGRFFHSDKLGFWKEKADDFAGIANEVLARNSELPDVVTRVAEYFHDGLSRPERAIEILWDARRDAVLDEPGSKKLVGYLAKRETFSGDDDDTLVPLLRESIADYPTTIDFRVELIRALQRREKYRALRDALQATNDHFAAKGLWREQDLAPLAEVCLESELYDQAVKYYQQLVAMMARQPRGFFGGIQQPKPGYYQNLSTAYLQLGDDVQAVDAAGAAVVLCRPQTQPWTRAMDHLKQTLRRLNDRDAFVAHLDRRAAETDTENPLVRKLLGQILFDENMFAQATAQLRIAAEYRPDDAEIHQALIQCYDRQNDPAGAIAQRFELLQRNRRDIAMYQDLARRLAEQPRERERAETSIIEMLPHEVESHAALAEIRQAQDRWDDAIEHWQRVAELRPLEPTGLLKLAEAQLHQRRWTDARETLERLSHQHWPPRFGDIKTKANQLRKQLPSHPCG